jgi:hypothetical protein
MKLHVKAQMELHMKLTRAYAGGHNMHHEIVGQPTMHDLFILVAFNIGSKTGTCLLASLGVES